MNDENKVEETNDIKKNESFKPQRGFGIASLVIAILSLVLFKYIFISVILALVASILGIIGLKKGDNTFALAGLTIGIISLLITFALFVILNLLDTVLFYVPDWYK